MIVVFPLQEKWSGLRDTGTKTDPRWGWLGLACETLILKAIHAGVGWVWLARLGLGVLQSGNVIIVIGITC